MPASGTAISPSSNRRMQKYDEWYGPYPYKQITLIDPEPDSAVGGMEYPTLITGGADWWEPSWYHFGLEVTVAHEFGHQYWYGMVASNEFEEPWLDEGINSYSESKVVGSLFGQNTSAAERAHFVRQRYRTPTVVLSRPSRRRPHRAPGLEIRQHRKLREHRLWQNRHRAHHAGGGVGGGDAPSGPARLLHALPFSASHRNRFSRHRERSIRPQRSGALLRPGLRRHRGA